MMRDLVVGLLAAVVASLLTLNLLQQDSRSGPDGEVSTTPSTAQSLTESSTQLATPHDVEPQTSAIARVPATIPTQPGADMVAQETTADDSEFAWIDEAYRRAPVFNAPTGDTTISGYVSDYQGRVVAGAVVHAVPLYMVYADPLDQTPATLVQHAVASARFERANRLRAQVGPHGGFALHGADSRQDYRIWAEHPAYRCENRLIVEDEYLGLPVHIKMALNLRLTIRAVLPDGSDLASGNVHCDGPLGTRVGTSIFPMTYDFRVAQGSAIVVESEDGAWRSEPYLLEVSSARPLPPQSIVVPMLPVVDGARSLRLAFTRDPAGAHLSTYCEKLVPIDAGTPFNPATIRALALVPGLDVTHQFSEDFTYRVRRVPTGRYLAVVYAEPLLFSVVAWREIVVRQADPQERTFDIPIPGIPREDMLLVAFPPEHRQLHLPSRVRCTYESGAGSVRLSCPAFDVGDGLWGIHFGRHLLPAAAREVQFELNLWEPNVANQTLTFPDGNVPAQIDLQLQPAATLAIHVRGPDLPLPEDEGHHRSRSLRCQIENVDTGERTGGTPTVEGECEYGSLPPGEYLVRLYIQGLLAEERMFSLQLPHGEVTFDLPRLSSLTVHGIPDGVSGCTLQHVSADGESLGSRYVRSEQSVCRAERVPAGEYFVIVRFDDETEQQMLEQVNGDTVVNFLPQ